MKNYLTLLAWTTSLWLSAQITHPEPSRNGFLREQIFDDLSAIRSTNSNIKTTERIGTYDGHFIYIVKDEEDYVLDVLVYNYLDSNHRHNGKITGRRVYWLERNLRLAYDTQRRVSNIDIEDGVSYLIEMDDKTTITIKYQKTVDNVVWIFLDSGTGVKSRAKRGLYIEDSEISDY